MIGQHLLDLAGSQRFVVSHGAIAEIDAISLAADARSDCGGTAADATRNVGVVTA